MPKSFTIPVTEPDHRARLVLRSLAALWVALIVIGCATLWQYSLTPGESAMPITGLPAEQVTDLPTLTMFLHPHCGCSRSSVRMLGQAVREVNRPVSVRLYFYCPQEEDAEWCRAALWELGASIPSAECCVDRGGELASRFGAVTSGQLFGFLPDGDRVFSGGITSGRGHEGRNAAYDSVISLIRGESIALQTFPVFGCRILNSAAQSENSTP